MTKIEKLEQDFKNTYGAWVATRGLVDEWSARGFIHSDKLEIRNHAWLEYVLARNTLLKELKNVR